MVGRRAEQRGGVAEGVAVEPDVLARGAHGLEAALDFLDLRQAHRGIVDVQHHGLHLRIGGSFLQGAGEIEKSQRPAGFHAQPAEQRCLGLAGFGDRAFEIVDRDDRFFFLRGGERQGGDEAEEDDGFHEADKDFGPGKAAGCGGFVLLPPDSLHPERRSLLSGGRRNSRS